VRQLDRPATSVPSGAPSATATVMPPITVAMARARISGGTIPTATEFAVGTKTPADRPISTRASIRSGRLVASAAAALARANVASAATRRGLRGTLPSSVAITGEPTA